MMCAAMTEKCAITDTADFFDRHMRPVGRTAAQQHPMGPFDGGRCWFEVGLGKQQPVLPI